MLCILLNLLLTITVASDTLPPPPPVLPLPAPKQEVLCNLPRLLYPLFPGCEELTNYTERKGCADQLLMQYIYSRLRYPDEAVRLGKEGVAVVSCTIDTRGLITEVKLSRNPGYGMGEEALRVFMQLKRSNIQFDPGTLGQVGHSRVSVMMNYPVIFRYDRSGRSTVLRRVTPPPPDTIYTLVEKMPLLEDCQSAASFEQSRCTTERLLDFVFAEMHLTPAITQSCVTGTVVVRFVVNRSGWMECPEVIRDPGNLFVDEILRVFSLMNKKRMRWRPAVYEGDPVDVYLTLPIRINYQ